MNMKEFYHMDSSFSFHPEGTLLKQSGVASNLILPNGAEYRTSKGMLL